MIRITYPLNMTDERSEFKNTREWMYRLERNENVSFSPSPSVSLLTFDSPVTQRIAQLLECRWSGTAFERETRVCILGGWHLRSRSIRSAITTDSLNRRRYASMRRLCRADTKWYSSDFERVSINRTRASLPVTPCFCASKRLDDRRLSVAFPPSCSTLAESRPRFKRCTRGVE